MASCLPHCRLSMLPYCHEALDWLKVWQQNSVNIKRFDQLQYFSMFKQSAFSWKFSWTYIEAEGDWLRLGWCLRSLCLTISGNTVYLKAKKKGKGYWSHCHLDINLTSTCHMIFSSKWDVLTLGSSHAKAANWRDCNASAALLISLTSKTPFIMA